MGFNIGVNVVEVDGRAAPTITAAPTGVAGFLIRSVRGIPDVPVALRSFGDFVNNFGSYGADEVSGQPLYGTYAVRGFFENGGATGYAVRVVGAGSVPAATLLKDRASPALNTLKVSAGMYGRLDPGKWGNSLQVSIVDHPQTVSALPAQIVGAAVEPFALSDGLVLDIDINGVAKALTITFHAADFADITAATAAAVARVINRQTTAVKAAVTPDRRLVLNGTTTGFSSLLTISGAAAAKLGFSGATATSDGALASGSKLATLQNLGVLRSGAAVVLESQGHVVAAKLSTNKLSKDAGLNVKVGTATVILTFKDADFAGGLAKTTVPELLRHQPPSEGFFRGAHHRPEAGAGGRRVWLEREHRRAGGSAHRRHR